MKSKLLTLFCLVLILSMAIAPVASAKPGSASIPNAPKKLTATPSLVYDETSLKNALRGADGRYSIIVQLAEPPLAQYSGEIAGLGATNPKSIGATRLDANSANSLAYVRHLKQSQASFTARLASVAPSAQVSFSYQAAFNGVAMQVTRAEVARIALMEGVTRIYPNQMRSVQMDSSLPLIKAAAEWTRLGGQSNAGKGIKVAVIDTGLDPNNPMFSGTGFTAPAGYPKGYCVTHPSDPDFQCNGKLIAARYFLDPILIPYLAPEEVASPFGVGSHGTHTAGTSVGRAVTASLEGVPLDISGVAPAAYLMVYKALFEQPTSGGGTDSMLVAALDAAVSDGADVINNSWGGGAGDDPNATIYNTVLPAITTAGILTVFAAGNDGPGAGTIGCPGCVESALTVAASTTSRTFITNLKAVSVSNNAISIPAALQSIQGSSMTGASVQAPIVDLEVEGVSDSVACSALTRGSLTDKIVVVRRGSCALIDKVVNAKGAGAIGVVIRNVAGGATTLPLVQPVLPTIHISQADGDALTAFLTTVKTASASATFKIDGPAVTDPTGSQADVIADFSSVGPNGDANILKPDVTAPGVNIVSASSPTLYSGASEPWFEIMDGTSMATPHVTGAAALLIQQHPDWSPMQIKSTLTSTSVQGLTKPDKVTPADPFDMGAGRIDLDRAGSAGLTFSKTSYANSRCILTCSWTTTLTNVSAVTATWTATTASSDHTLAISVSPASVSLPPGASIAYTVTTDITQVNSDLWHFGSVVWKNSADAFPDAYLPLAVQAGQTTNAAVLNETVDLTSALNKSELTYTINVSNPFPDQTTFTIGGTLSDKLAFKPGSATGGLDYNPATRKLSASATIPGYVLDVAPTGKPTLYTAGDPNGAYTFDMTPNCDIDGGDKTCDEMVYAIGPADFYYMGVHYSSFKVSSNGFIVPGSPKVTPSSGNTNLPLSASPNNIIAPLWTDLEFANPTGHWMVWGTQTQTIIEWQGANAYGNTAKIFNFEIIITDGTNEITFAYGDLNTAALANGSGIGFTVGAENSDGSAGKAYYFSTGTTADGTAPAKGTDLAVINDLSSSSMTFKANAALLDLAKPVITNVVNSVNNFNADFEQAAAYTTVTIFQYFWPTVNK